MPLKLGFSLYIVNIIYASRRYIPHRTPQNTLGINEKSLEKPFTQIQGARTYTRRLHSAEGPRGSHFSTRWVTKTEENSGALPGVEIEILRPFPHW